MAETPFLTEECVTTEDVSSLSLFERIKKLFPGLSDARAKVARFVVDHWDEAAFMSAAKLGQAVGVSETVVVRFSSLLGFSGYSEMQAELQARVRHRLANVMVARLDSEPEKTSEGDLLSHVNLQSAEAVSKVFQLNSSDAITRSAKMILDARRVFVIGLRSTFGPAQVLSQNLNQMLLNTRTLDLGADDLFLQLNAVMPDDLLIALTFARYNSFTYKAVRMAKDRNAKVLVITDDRLAPVASHADHALICDVTGPSFGNTHVGTITLINAVLEVVVHLNKRPIRTALAELEETLEIYYPGRSIPKGSTGRR